MRIRTIIGLFATVLVAAGAGAAQDMPTPDCNVDVCAGDDWHPPAPSYQDVAFSGHSNTLQGCQSFCADLALERIDVCSADPKQQGPKTCNQTTAEFSGACNAWCVASF